MKKLFLILILLLIPTFVHALAVKITVKEAAGVNVKNYPVTIGIPLAYGAYTSTSTFGVFNAASGGTRQTDDFYIQSHWMPDGTYIRTVLVTFLATVAANSKATYYFRDNGTGNGTAMSATDDKSNITVDTGKIKAIIKKSGFNLFDSVYFDANGDGNYTSDEQVIVSSATNGGNQIQRDDNVQHDSDRTTGLSVSIIRNGPLVTIVQASAPTVYVDGATIPTVAGGAGQPETTHGFMCRMYFYKNLSFVKVEYTLQSSDNTVELAYPMYFKDFTIKLATNLNANSTLNIGREYKGTSNNYSATLSAGGKYILESAEQQTDYSTKMQWAIRNSSDDSLIEKGVPTSNTVGGKMQGWLDISDNVSSTKMGVTASISRGWQTFPKALEADTSGNLYVRLYPSKGTYYYTPWGSGYLVPSVKGLYWLSDAQNVYHKIMFYFHSGSDSSSNSRNLALIFDKAPEPWLDESYYNSSRGHFRTTAGVFPTRVGGAVYNPEASWWTTINRASAFVNHDSASGQPKLYVTSTNGFVVGNTVLIAGNQYGNRSESKVISSIGSDGTGAYLQFTANLSYTHTAAQTDCVLVKASNGYYYGADYGVDMNTQAGISMGVPYTLIELMTGGSVIDYYDWYEARVRGTLNYEQPWLPNYNYARDQSNIQITPGMDGTIRNAFASKVTGNAHGFYPLDGNIYFPHALPNGWVGRDMEHWSFDFLENYYDMTGALWVKDWFYYIDQALQIPGFIPGFNANYILGPAIRQIGHMMSTMMEAYRVIEDPTALTTVKTWVDGWNTNKCQWFGYWNDCTVNSVNSSVFMYGAVEKGFIDIFESIPPSDPYKQILFDSLQSVVDWHNYFGAGYYGWNEGDIPEPGNACGAAPAGTGTQDCFFGTTGNNYCSPWVTAVAPTMPAYPQCQFQDCLGSSGFRLGWSLDSRQDTCDGFAYMYYKTGLSRYNDRLVNSVNGTWDSMLASSSNVGPIFQHNGGHKGIYCRYLHDNPKSVTTRPGKITNLTAIPTSTNSVQLSWTVPTGTVARYQVKMSTRNIVESGDVYNAYQTNWSSYSTRPVGHKNWLTTRPSGLHNSNGTGYFDQNATWWSTVYVTDLSSSAPTPLSPGSTQTMQVTGLAAGITYYFAIKSYDWVFHNPGLEGVPGNVSDISNVASVDTSTYNPAVSN